MLRALGRFLRAPSRDSFEHLTNELKQYAPFLLAGLALILIWWVESRTRSAGATVSPLDDLTRWAPRLLLASAGLAVVTMTIVEGIKRRMRSDFHKRALESWLQGSDEDLLDRVAPRYRDDVLGLPIELLCAQVANAADAILSEAEGRGSLLSALAGPSGRDAVNDAVEAAKELKLMRLPGGTGRDAKSIYAKFKTPSDLAPVVAELRAEVSRRMQRNLDAFQAHVTAGWGREVRFQCFVVGTSLAFGLAVAFADVGGQPAATLAAVLTIGLLTGALAPVARDAAALLERARR